MNGLVKFAVSIVASSLVIKGISMMADAYYKRNLERDLERDLVDMDISFTGGLSEDSSLEEIEALIDQARDYMAYQIRQGESKDVISHTQSFLKALQIIRIAMIKENSNG